MIDLSTEKLIPVREVPKLLPPRPTGKRVHVSAVYRWIQRGVRGVRLETITIGGTTYTSTEALQRFADQRSNSIADSSPPSVPTTAARQKQIDRAAKQVEEILGSSRPKKHRR